MFIIMAEITRYSKLHSIVAPFNIDNMMMSLD